jgi:hypothetical protein
MIWVWVPIAFLVGIWVGFRWSRVMIAYVWKDNPGIVLDKLGYAALAKLDEMVGAELAKRRS